MQAYILGASTRKQMRLSRDKKMMTALKTTVGSTDGLVERQVYRVIAAMTLGMHNNHKGTQDTSCMQCHSILHSSLCLEEAYIYK